MVGNGKARTLVRTPNSILTPQVGVEPCSMHAFQVPMPASPSATPAILGLVVPYGTHHAMQDGPQWRFKHLAIINYNMEAPTSLAAHFSLF